MVRHQMSFLSVCSPAMLIRTAEELRISRVGAHVPDTSARDYDRLRGLWSRRRMHRQTE